MKTKNFSPQVFILFWIMVLMLGSCDFKKLGVKPSTGKTNEILVVTNSDADWKGRMGNTIRDFFAQIQPGLPQDENMYTLAHIPQANLSEMLKTHHNIFIVDVNPEFEQPLIETKKDLWARPQRVIKMTVPNTDEFYKIFNEKKETFLELFNANERRRITLAFDAIEDVKIRNRLISEYDVSMRFPKGFYIAVDTNNFVWIRREAERFSQGVILYFYPYTEMTSFNPDVIVRKQDSITKKYIPGPAKGSYMKISMFEPPVTKQIEFNGGYAVEMRGLWELQNDFMGGPFISYTFVDEQHNRVVTIMGYVYNPSQDKRDLVRQVEAILYTFQYPEQAKEQASSGKLKE
jgi:hypothetical protein